MNSSFPPQVFREDGIISGYRDPQSSAKDCLLSSFQLTNETINIWTHFLPTWWVLPARLPCADRRCKVPTEQPEKSKLENNRLLEPQCPVD